MTGLYKLENGEPVPMDNAMEWACWFQAHEQRLALTTVGNVRVSTVFLGVDQSWQSKRPLLFETMVFKGNSVMPPLNRGFWSDSMWRYGSMAEAVRGTALPWRLCVSFSRTRRLSASGFKRGSW